MVRLSTHTRTHTYIHTDWQTNRRAHKCHALLASFSRSRFALAAHFCQKSGSSMLMSAESSETKLACGAHNQHTHIFTKTMPTCLLNHAHMFIKPCPYVYYLCPCTHQNRHLSIHCTKHTTNLGKCRPLSSRFQLNDLCSPFENLINVLLAEPVQWIGHVSPFNAHQLTHALWHPAPYLLVSSIITFHYCSISTLLQ